MSPTRAPRQSITRRRLGALGLLVPAALGFSATQAHAAGESITMVQNDPTAIVGHATNFTASGTLNPDDTMFGFSVYIFMKDADLDGTCAADESTEAAAAMSSGGQESWVSPGGTGFDVGMGPTYSQPFKVTFGGSGHYLLCGYVNGDFSTFASGELRGTVVDDSPAPTPTPTPTAQRPGVVRKPWITRKRHALTCHAGIWSNQPTHRSYRWSVQGRRASVGTRRKLTVPKKLRGRKLICRVTASNSAGSRTATARAVRAR
jgi:hypothetical protein